MAAKLKTKSDVPRFLAMLKENNVPAEYCVGLFSCWCSNEGTAILAEKCIMIQAKYGMTMTAVWEWVCTNEPCPDTDWPEEVDRFMDEIVTADFKNDSTPVLDQYLCFSYRGYQFELSACNIISTKEQMLGLTNESFKQQFPHGVFTDRYVCWMQGHKDHLGHTKDYVDDPEDWTPSIYLVPGAWSWGAESDLRVCAEVNPIILKAIDKFLETFKE